MTVTEARSRTHADLDATRRREVDLLAEVLGRCLGGGDRSTWPTASTGSTRCPPPGTASPRWSIPLTPSSSRGAHRASPPDHLADERHRARLLQHQPTPGTPMLCGRPCLPQSIEVRPLDHLRIHPVLTAHPTEARRRAVATALRRIAEQLTATSDPRGRRRALRGPSRLLEEVDLLYRTSVLRGPGRGRPTRSRPS